MPSAVGYQPTLADEMGVLQEPTAKMSKSGANPKGIINLLDEPKTSAKRIDWSSDVCSSDLSEFFPS